MSHIAYDFLANSLFLHDGSLQSKFENESTDRIEKELLAYREHIIRNMPALNAEINQSRSNLNVFTSKDNTPISLLKQTALYLEHYVIADPLFHYTNLESKGEAALSSFLGFPERINKSRLAEVCSYLKEITSMVAGNFIKVFPVTYHFETPKQLPIKIPVNNNNDLLPPDLMRFFREHWIISPMEKIEGGGWAIFDKRDLVPTRAINIEFEGDRFNQGMVYFLTEQKVLSYDETSGLAEIARYIPPTPPSQELFDAWVLQSANTASKAYFDRTFGEVYLAERLNSRFICESDFKSEVLSKNLEPAEDISAFTTNQLLNIELPFLQNVDAAKLMQVREADADTFTNFRLELEKQFREIRTITDPKDLKLKTENIFHELNEVQGQKINQKMKYIHKQVFLNSVLAAGGLIGSLTVGGVSAAGLALALAKGYKDYRDYIQNVKENPAYFLWKTK